jgi:predicted dehydrogenase
MGMGQERFMNDNGNHTALNRRDFLRGGSLATLAALAGGIRLRAQPADAETAPPPVQKVKVAVIGLGTWGRELLDQLARIPQADVAAVCDHYPAFLKRAGAKAPHAKRVEDYKAVLAEDEIKAVIVATPTHLHKEIVLAALAAGKHVYCESPLAVTLEDAKAIALAAKKYGRQVFQPGLQLRSDPQEAFLLQFVRSGAAGKWASGRSQWNKKTSWRISAPNPEREKVMNWRLDPATSLGLVGEVGLHQIDRASWYFNGLPEAVSGRGAVTFWKDGRTVADSVQAVFEYPGGAHLSFESTLVNSFESETDIYYGSDAAVMIREGAAWMFKEADAPLLGWEVYARKDTFHKETGISLKMDASKLTSQGDQDTDTVEAPDPPIFFALQNFLRNTVEVTQAVEDFVSIYGDDEEALAEHLTKGINKLPAADYLDGYRATVLAIKANEAIVKGERIVMRPEWYELA